MKPRTHTLTLLLLAALLGAVLMRWLAPETVVAQSADSGGRYVAVTGPYEQGVSLLYVLDQETQHLAVYEARGGAPNSRKVIFVGARNIGLDLLLDGFNDESTHSYQEIAEQFQKRGLSASKSSVEEPEK
ncbi:MAG TPA: hypothetical protein QGG59_01710 [Planctomycetota bacterium]|jgi:hypothetical protein|nr:hypothetical protein [Planctomycetota bacterium]MDP7245604.1 hypothetical protein [Planctomycetota bacterium]MDP7559897.1 hypothetical protein [Planctomycetota bacterium]HJM38810.1 hypothetical protein [Planctomycetota bacterium]